MRGKDEPAKVLTTEELHALRAIDTCMVANAIESFNVRLRNTGFADARLHCMLPDLPPMLGYAATARLRSGEPPIGGGTFRDGADFWNRILEVPAPRVLVLEDMDEKPGRGSFVGNAHAAILKALRCVGYVTNGAVRELPDVRALDFHLFAGNVTVSHAYAHIFEIGSVVKIGGLEVHSGDLLHGDRHGVLTVPQQVASKIPAAAERLRLREQQVIEFCRSPNFSVEGLQDLTKDLQSETGPQGATRSR
ncbi:MAG: RraA family protein [Candidatus Sulfotelmatobacter sp.]